MGYFPIYRPAEGKPTSATYTGTTVTHIDGYYVLLDKVVTLNAVE